MQNIESTLHIALLASKFLTAGAFCAGYLVGRWGRKRSGMIVLIAFVAAITALLMGLAAPLAAKGYHVVLEVGGLLAFSLDYAFVSGFVIGRLRQVQQRVLMGVLVVLALVLVGGALMRVSGLSDQVMDILRQLGLDKPAEKYEPKANKDCPENLKSLYIALSGYADSHDALPPKDWMNDSELISRVIKNEWLHCPAVSNRHDEKYGYAYNEALAGRKLNGKPLSAMPNAATTPLLYDSTNLTKSAHDAVTSLPKPGRHGGRNNILYCDGTVKAEPPK